jgi:hypothetical protein
MQENTTSSCKETCVSGQDSHRVGRTSKTSTAASLQRPHMVTMASHRDCQAVVKVSGHLHSRTHASLIL